MEPRSGRRSALPGCVAAVRWLLMLTVTSIVGHAGGQVGDVAPVALDDSPVADRLLAEVEAQSVDNPRRAADLLSDLLDEYGDRVVATPDRPEVFQSVRAAALAVLVRDAAVRSAWLERCDAEAAALLAEAGEVETLRRRPMTEAGLEAALRLAQTCIESGSPDAGLRLLEEVEGWPGASAVESRRRQDILRAIAWIAIARAEDSDANRGRRDDAIDRVRRVAEEVADRLVTWTVNGADGEGAVTEAGVDPADRAWTVLWEEPLEASLHRRRTTDMATGRMLHSNPEAIRRSGIYLTSVPVVVGDLVIVNEGRLLEGVDRYTGRLRWFRDFDPGRMFGGSGRPGDLAEIAVADGDAYTILGNAFGDRRGDDRSIIRFDPTTGRERWEVRPDRIPDQPLLEDAEACGGPLLLGDLVVVPLRKVTARLETIELVIALDRADGGLRWIRSIASSGSMRSSSGRPVSRLTAIDGDVLIASAAGATARLDGRTGEVVWLRREEVPLAGLSTITEAWQIAAPVVLDAGVAVLDPSRRHWQLLDPETGALLQRHPIGAGTIGGAAAWLDVVRADTADASDLLLLIGNDVVAIDPRFPERIVWSLQTAARDAGITVGPLDAAGVRGRVRVDGDVVLVPTVDAVLSIDPRTGRVARLFEIDGPVNPVMASDAIHVVGVDSLATIMPVMDAVATLERRIRESPDAVPQAMGLLELAGRIGRVDMQLLAARAAVDGLAGADGDQWREEVLDLILAAVPSAGDADGEVLLELAASAAGNVAGDVRHRLARAAWLEARGRRPQAVDVWLDIVGDADLSAVLIREGADHDVAAGTLARSRLREARRADPMLGARLDEAALVEVRSAIESRETAAVLVELARRAAGTDAAMLAASRAVEILRDEGDPMSAAGVALVVTRDFEPGDPRRDALLQTAATACADAGRPGLQGMLRAMTASVETPSSRPVVGGVPDHIETIRGRLAAMTPNAAKDAPTDLILLHESDTSELVARDADALSERWRRPWAKDHLVVQWSPDLLVWEGATQRQPILSALDPDTGEIRWSTPDVTRLLPAPDRLSVNADGFLPDGAVFQPWEILSLPLDEGILLVRRDGAASLVDRVDGRTVLWSRRAIMDRVHGITTAAGLVHVHGSGVDRRGEVVGRVLSLDPGSGRIVLDETVPSGEIRWAVPDAMGRLAVGTTSEIQVFDPIGILIGSGDRWRRRRPVSEEVRLGWVAGRDLVLVDDASSTVAWNIEDGRIVADRWSVPEDRVELLGRPLASLDLGDRRVLHLDARVVMHDSEGGLLGVDAMGLPGRRDWRALPVDDGVLLVTRITAGIPGGAVHRVQRLDTEAGLRLSGRPFEIAGGRSYADVRAVDGWLLLSTEVETHAVPMSASPDSISDLPGRP